MNSGSMTQGRRNRRERGFVLITMAIASVAIILVLGLAVDIGRIFITKNETQAYCDAAALAATLKLDGTTAGITKAQAAVAASTNSWNFSTVRITSPAVTFATSVAGPWVSSPSPATGYIFTRVIATAPQQLYFMPVIVPQYTENVASAAVAAQVAITSFPRGLAPYTAVSTNTVGPLFGLTIGDSYDIQWPQFNATRAGCAPDTPTKCFNSPPCAGDSSASKAAVVANWGASNSGYWGGNSNSIIEQEILDVIQIQAVGVGTNIFPILTNGTKASEAGYLDQRASQDINTSDNTVAGYLGSPHNGRRLLAMPIVDPVDPAQTNVIGYGLFLLLANGPGATNYYTHTTNGNDPFCALYAGSYNIGSNSPGTAGTTGASRVKLVQ